MIHPEVEFPDIHLHLDHVQFQIKSGHTWLHIPEQLLMSEAEYKKQQQQQQEQIAKEMETSVATLDLIEQQKIWDQYRVKQSVSQGKKI